MSTKIETDVLREIDVSPDAPRRMDQAVRAALRTRPPEPRSFGNEDDLEGPHYLPRDAAGREPAAEAGGKPAEERVAERASGR